MTPPPAPASPAFRPAGIVLAAGASRRMGTPKALLPTPSGLPLAAHQAARLRTAGCAPAAVVIGSAADAVRAALPPTLPTIENPRWSQGRATSLQAAVSALPDATGWLFLPIDAIGIRLETLQALLAAATWSPDTCFRGRCRQIRPVATLLQRHASHRPWLTETPCRRTFASGWQPAG